MTLNGVELTPREEDIARLVAEGMSEKGIAEALGLTPGTAKSYTCLLYRKVGIGAYDDGSQRVRLARMVWTESNPVLRLQAMALRASELVVA